MNHSDPSLDFSHPTGIRRCACGCDFLPERPEQWFCSVRCYESTRRVLAAVLASESRRLTQRPTVGRIDIRELVKWER